MSKVDNEEMATDIDNKKAGLSIALGLISYVFLVLAVYLAYRLMSISLIFGPIGVCSAISAFTLCKKGYQHNTKKRILINIGKQSKIDINVNI